MQWEAADAYDKEGKRKTKWGKKKLGSQTGDMETKDGINTFSFAKVKTDI